MAPIAWEAAFPNLVHDHLQQFLVGSRLKLGMVRHRVSHLDRTMQSAASRHRVPGGTIRVLLADDHRIVREGLVGILSDEPGMSVVGEAADGAEAVEMARRLDPDVVIMDVTMPGMSGL